MALKE